MTWTQILFWGWMTFAYVPFGGVAVYDAPMGFVDADNSYFVELGGEATYGCFFAGGSMKTSMWKTVEDITFWPNQIEYSFDAGIKFDGFRLGYMHTCFHPVDVNGEALRWIGRQFSPKWEGSYDMVYLRVEGGKR